MKELKVYKIRTNVKDTYTKKTCVSISYDELNLVITREQGARLTKNEFCCVILRFLKDNKSLLEEAMNYRFKYTDRAVYWYTSDYDAVDYYIKYSTETGFVVSKFLFHETMSGFVLDNSPIKIFLPDLIQLLLDGALDFASDKVVLDYANKLIDIIKNADDIDVELYHLANSLPEGCAEIIDISARNQDELQKLQEFEPMYTLKDLIV